MRRPAGVGGLLRRAAAGTGLQEVLHLQRQVESLEEAVAENRALEGPLAEQVAELERSLVPVLAVRLERVRAHRGDRT